MVSPLNPILEEALPEKDETAGIEKPLRLLKHVPEDPAALLDLANHSIVSSRQFTSEHVKQLIRLAAKHEAVPQQARRPLVGKILISAFYEPSTRTRLSFESAWHRLGGDIMSITDPATTGIAKGESFSDVGEMLNNYGDLVVLRETNHQAIYRMMEGLRIPIVNAGNGTDEHPTQALADMYAIFKWRLELMDKDIAENKKVRIGIVGLPSTMRTVRSLLYLLALFPQSFKEVVIICNEEEVFSESQKENLEEMGLILRVSNDLKKELPKLDIVYINSIAWIGDDYKEFGQEFALSKSSPLKKGAIIMHPLARGRELSTDLDDTPHNWYFAQARGAVFIRMALLTCLVQHNW
ncbi:MAG: aspartate carbamoyltransferase [Gammaproteobacteria bacterium]|nr:aspartate carbamoyltransferase [Gammaproteobacteria bacterium]MDH5691487.1 aspartate carbamoyltransferase [Gammaproteobacteria bacterium]